MEQVQKLQPMEDPDGSLPFIRQILTNLRSEVGNASAVLGFVGTPWTLAAYSMEGKHDKCGSSPSPNNVLNIA
jgi:uroporphyrinogen decarboxylase